MTRAPLILVCAAFALPACAPDEAGPFAGSQRCSGCHAEQFARWRGSHHELAMQEAHQGSVIGDFNDAELRHMGVVSRFSRDGERFLVAAEGPEGQTVEYEIAYTFGVEPLQQYLVRFPQGRLQALTVAWDARPAREGGQRWFSLQPDEAVPPNDPLHWTGPGQRWNLMCADCHSTGLRKGYSLADDRYETTYAEIDVGCEACHGPGAAHVAWAEGSGDSAARALPVRLPPRGDWVFEGDAPIAARTLPLESRVEVETCGRCHARRGRLAEGPAGLPLMDTHRPALLSEGLYHPDGQIRDEVYVYGSFLQSRMYAAGVSCSDCHEPHGLEVAERSDDTCARCHRPDVFATPAHHHHRPESSGASCVACHMPEQIYMVIDGRRDHGFKIPRPDLSVELGVPNACSGCHAGQPAQWAADALKRDFRGGREPLPHFGQVLAAGRAREPGAAQRLAALALDAEQPAIVRATALELLAEQPGDPIAPEVVELAARDPDPLVRMAAGGAARALPPEQRLPATVHLLRDPRLAVRLESLSALLAVPAQAWSARDRSRLALAQQEYRAAQAVDADRPEAHVNLGILELRSGDIDAARRAYQTALRIGPHFLPAYVNLADLYRADEQEERGEQVLRQGLERAPESAELWHALGLLLVRGERAEEALEALSRAAALEDDSRYTYVYGVALYSTGRSRDAIPVLERGHRRHPGDPDLLFALATMHRDLGDLESARIFAAKLIRILPRDQRAAGLAVELAATP